MVLRFGVLFAASALLAVALIALSYAGSSGEKTSAGSFVDCRTVSATPTATGTPWPTPPFRPYESRTICNDTAQVADDLHIELARPAGNENFLSANPPGCGTPLVQLTDSATDYTQIDMQWPEPCVDPGEAIGLRFEATCETPEQFCIEPKVSCFYWTLDGVPVPSETPAIQHPNNPPTCDLSETATPTPTPSPSPTPGPSDCRSRTWGPSGTPSPWPAPPFTPYADASLCNDTGIIADDLHITLAGPAGNENFLTANAPGCDTPLVQLSDDPGAYTQVDMQWPEPCVDPGETVDVHFEANCTTPDAGCVTEPNVACFNWTQGGTTLFFESWAPLNPSLCEGPTPTFTITPTPTPSLPPGECPARPTPPITAEPTPFQPPHYYPPGTFLGTDRDGIFQATVPFCNDAGVAASDLHIHFSWAFSFASLIENPDGCPEPDISQDPGYLDRWDLDIDWGTACVDEGESISFTFTFGCGSPCGPPEVYCYTWTLDDVELDSVGACPPLPFQRLWGDIDCTGNAGPADALKTLMAAAEIPIAHTPSCPAPGAPITVDGDPGTWGDFDCDGDASPRDALAILYHDAGLEAQVTAPCPELATYAQVAGA